MKMSNDDSSIINWKSVFSQSETFVNNKPFKFCFIENFLNRDFFEKLYEVYPKIDESWDELNMIHKHQYNREWNPENRSEFTQVGDDPKLDSNWNLFKKYVESDEFIENIKEFSGIEVNKLKYFRFIDYKKGGFTQPHAHDDGPNTLVMMLYFSKDGEKGEPGGTFVATDYDDESIIFEPYNLDNSLVIFHDGPNAIHGCRYITKDVARHSVQITLEKYSSETGWSGGTEKSNKQKKNSQLVDIS